MTKLSPIPAAVAALKWTPADWKREFRGYNNLTVEQIEFQIRQRRIMAGYTRNLGPAFHTAIADEWERILASK